MKRFFIPLLILATFWHVSCEKNNISNNPSLKLDFSNDTVIFDTVFTTIGSATRRFKVYNNSNNDLVISSIRLAGGSSSPYRINIDGLPTTSTKDVYLRGNDSLFVFVEVTIDPANQNNPLLVPDSVIFVTNNNIQDVKLMSWGQDVILYNAETLTGHNTFTSEKPYLIYDYLYIDQNGELNIEAGAKLHFHNFAQLVVSGSLKINGEPENPVVFEGDRLEPFYRDKAGQWGGIWLTAGSRNNSINWAEIKNAVIGVIVDTFAVANQPTLIIHNTRIENMSAAALYARGAIVEAGNCLFANAGQVNVALTLGGQYSFYHCTIANYWGQYISRKGPALLLNNYYTYTLEGSSSEYLETRDLTKAYFANCIIYGSRSNELTIDNIYNGQVVDAQMNYIFENSILQVDQDIDLTDQNHFKNLLTDDPKFIDPYQYNYELDTLSPAKDFGLIHIALEFPIDLNNSYRLDDTKPDLGAFERQE